MGIEEVFSSKLRVRILKVILQVGELNVSDIARRLGVNYTSAVKHLEILEREGIIQHKQFGRIRIYRLSPNSPKAKAIQSLFETWQKEAETKGKQEAVTFKVAECRTFKSS